MTARRWFAHADASPVRSGGYFRSQRNLDNTGSVQRPGFGWIIGLDWRHQNSKRGMLHAASLTRRRGTAAHFKKGFSSAENIVRTPMEASRAGGLDQARKRRLAYAKAPSSKSENSSGVHRLEELRVVLGVAQLVEQEVDRVHRAHRIEDPAQHVHLLEELRIGDQLFLAGAGARDVDRGEGALVGNLAIENQFGIAS